MLIGRFLFLFRRLLHYLLLLIVVKCIFALIGFCHNFLQELEKMKEIAKLKELPPVYIGKWAAATDAEVQEQLAKGTPYTYRFRVPREGSLTINDLIRGKVCSTLQFFLFALLLLFY